MKNDIITIEVEGDHLAWNNELDQINSILITYEKKLSELDSTNRKVKIERFQNQFIIQKQAISKIKNEIQKHELTMERAQHEAFDNVDKHDLKYHKMISKKVGAQFEIFADLQKEYLEFIAGI